MSNAALIAEKPARFTSLRVFQRVFSFPVVLVAFLAVLAVLTVRDRFNDPDMWWHLKTGEVIWTSRHIPISDIFSYTTHHHSIIPQEWLSQVLIYGAYRLGGYSGMMLWLCVSTTILLVAGYVLCSLYSGNAKIGFIGAMILWFFSTVGLAVRPQVVGYLLLTVELLLVHLGRTRNPRWFFGLPFLFGLWVNCHASFFLGFFVLGVFLFCSFLDFQASSLVCVRWDRTARLTFSLAAAISAVALFLNPVGAKQVMYPVNTMLRLPINLSQSEEWKPLLVSDPRGIALLGILALVGVVLIIQRKEVLFLDELLMLGAGAWLALNHQRMAFVFGILAGPVVCRLISACWDKYDADKDLPLPNAILLTMAALAVFFAFPSRQALARQVDAGNPVKAVSYIRTHRLSGNMLNSYVYGGYLIWALPEKPVFVDGRGDVFEWTGVLGEFVKLATLQADPSELLDKYDVSFCLLERDAPMTYVLPLMHNWQRVYSDDKSVIFARTTAAIPTR